jgi:hypothetical protein
MSDVVARNRFLFPSNSSNIVGLYLAGEAPGALGDVGPPVVVMPAGLAPFKVRSHVRKEILRSECTGFVDLDSKPFDVSEHHFRGAMPLVRRALLPTAPVD